MPRGAHELEKEWRDTISKTVSELDEKVATLNDTCHRIELSMTALVKIEQAEKVQNGQEHRIRALEDAKVKLWTTFGVLWFLTVAAWGIYTKFSSKP